MGNTLVRARVAALVVVVALGACGRTAGMRAGTPGDSVDVGYGAQPAGSVATSVQDVHIDRNAHQSGSVVDMLEGRVAGLQVVRLDNGQVSLRLRGTNSINMSNEPLVVIDGVVVPPEGVGYALQAVAPGDVAQIDVLKDAGSTAIYGSRGANGVILIRTNRH